MEAQPIFYWKKFLYVYTRCRGIQMYESGMKTSYWNILYTWVLNKSFFSKILINFIFYLFEYKLFYWCIKIGYIAETNIRSNEIISMRHIFFVIRWKTSKYILRNGTNDIMCCQRGATCQMTIFFYTILD